jgi:hypothetical protein
MELLPAPMLMNAGVRAHARPSGFRKANRNRGTGGVFRAIRSMIIRISQGTIQRDTVNQCKQAVTPGNQSELTLGGGLIEGGMVGPDLARLSEVTTQIRAETRDRGRAKCQPCARFVPTPVAGHPRGSVSTDREAVDASVNQAYSLVAWPCGRPFGPPCPSCWRGGEQSAADKSLSRRGLFGTSENVKKARGGPGAERDVCEHRVNSVAKPIAAQQSAAPSATEHGLDRGFNSFHQRVEGLCVLEP